MRNKNWYIGILAVLFLMSSFSACSDASVYQHKYILNNQTWTYDKPFQFDFDIQDTISGYDLIINLSHKKQYAYSNLYLFVDVEDPNKKTYRDTINCFLCDYAGRFYGDVSGEDVELDLLYKQRISFPDLGTYTIRLEQAMRDSSLQNINSVGLTIKAYQP